MMLGNIRVHLKGYDHVLDLAERVKNANLPVQITIAGRDDSEGWFANEIKVRNLGSILLYNGDCADPNLFLSSGQAFLLMSRIEGMPNALIEAMSLGLPCISTRVGDVGTFCQDREHLRVVEIGDIEGVISIFQDFLADWPTARAMGERARSLCLNQFTVSAAADKIMLLLKDVRA